MTLMNPQPLSLAKRLSSVGKMCFASRRDETIPPHHTRVGLVVQDLHLHLTHIKVFICSSEKILTRMFYEVLF